MVEVTCRLTSRKRVFVPGVHAFDEHSGEEQDPAGANLPVLFALVPAGSPDPEEDDYVAGEWADGAPSSTAMIVLGPGGAIEFPESGVYDLWMGVNGTEEAPREPVGRVVVP
jgi:hypothetical protein